MQQRVTWEIVSKRQPLSTEARPRLTLVCVKWPFSMLPFRAVNNYSFSLYWMLIKYIYMTSGFKTLQVNWKFVFVFSNVQTTPFRIYGKPYAHKFCAVDIFGASPRVKQYHLFPSSITCRARFHDSAGEYWKG